MFYVSSNLTGSHMVRYCEKRSGKVFTRTHSTFRDRRLAEEEKGRLNALLQSGATVDNLLPDKEVPKKSVTIDGSTLAIAQWLEVLGMSPAGLSWHRKRNGGIPNEQLIPMLLEAKGLRIAAPQHDLMT